MKRFIFITLFSTNLLFANEVQSLQGLQHKYYQKVEAQLQKDLKVENLTDKEKYTIYNQAVKSLTKYNFLGFSKNYIQKILKLNTKLDYTSHYISLLEIYDLEKDSVLLNHTLENFKSYTKRRGRSKQARSYINYYSLLKSDQLSREMFSKEQRLEIVQIGKTREVQLHNIKVLTQRKSYDEIYGYLQSLKKDDMSYMIPHVFSAIILNKKKSYACLGQDRGIILHRSCELFKQVKGLSYNQLNDKVVNLIGLIEAVSSEEETTKTATLLLNEILKEREK